MLRLLLLPSRSFLSTSSGYAPASGEILGILRQLKEDMEKELDAITKAENASITESRGARFP